MRGHFGAMFRRMCRRLLLLALLSGVAAVLLSVGSGAWRERWHGYVVQQLEQRGVHLEFDRLGLSLAGRLVARDVRIYNDQARRQLLARLDRVNVAFDFGQLVRGKLQLEGLELTRANVAMPLDPERPDLTVIELKDFEARVFLRDRHLEVAHATGLLAGVRMDVTVDLLLGESPASAEEKKAAQVVADRRLEVFRQQREQIQTALNWLGRFQFETPPMMTVEVKGATNALEKLEAEVTLAGREFTYRGYECRELMAEAGLAEGEVVLRRLRVVDKLGSLDARATWRRGKEEVDFRVTSNADLTTAADILVGTEALREVVFYDQGPSLALEGRFFFGKAGAEMKRPVDVRGQIHCPRFASRGEVFEGLSASFGVNSDGIYVRDGLVRHRTGSLALQVLAHEQEGLRYRATLKMDPAAFKPFISKEQTRDLIDRFQFERDSGIYVKAEGRGPTLAFADCRTWGQAELRGFSYRGLPVVKADGELEFQGPHLIFRRVKAECEDGPAEVDEVESHAREGWVRLSGVRAKGDPEALLRVFVPKVADVVARYKLPPQTLVNVDGTFGWGGVRASDSRVGFAVEKGTGVYRLWESDYAVELPQGELLFRKDEMDFDIRGRVFGGSLRAVGKTDLAADRDEFSAALNLGVFKHALLGEERVFTNSEVRVSGSNGKIRFDGSGRLMGGPMTVKGEATTGGNYQATVTLDPFRWMAFGEELVFQGATAKLDSQADQVTYDVMARLMGGQFAAKGRVDLSAQTTPYEGEIQVNGLSFAEFARTYTPGYETEGDLTGHFRFSGELDDWKKLRGEGVGIIVNGNLYAIPILGPLTPLLGGFLPSPIKGYNVAKEANCTFRVENGFVFTEDLEALTSAFRLVAKGNADFIENRVEFDAQARMRGLPGLVLRPVSELLEYQARGTIGEPDWKPRLFNLGGRAAATEAGGVKPATNAGKSEAETAPGSLPEPPEAEKKRLRLPNFLRPGSNRP